MTPSRARALVSAAVVVSLLTTTAAQSLIKDIRTTPVGSNPSSSPRNPIKLGSNIYFHAKIPGYGCQIWWSDGTAANTQLLQHIGPAGSANSCPPPMTRVGNALFFEGPGLDGQELWMTDGAPAGTRLVKDINSGGSSWPGWMADVGGVCFLKADDGVTGAELWRSDGTAAGTYLVHDINPGAAGSIGSPIVSFGGRAYFAAYEPSTGQELWSGWNGCRDYSRQGYPPRLDERLSPWHDRRRVAPLLHG